MNFPWLKRPALSSIDVEAVAREAASLAVKDAVADIQRGVTDALSPLMAPGPGFSQSPYGAYALDFPIWYSTPQSPRRRPGSIVTTDTLRKLADGYDVLRACIQHLKREVRTVPIKIVSRDVSLRGRPDARIASATQFFDTEGGLGGFGRRRSRYEGALLEDLLVIGAAAVFYPPDRRGSPVAALDIDAATIRPRVDAYGWPGPGHAVYEQWIQDVLIAQYTSEQMDYIGLAENERSYSPYPASSIEWLVQSVNAALRVDQWNLSFLTDGSTPADVFSVPENWTPDQLLMFQKHWDAMLSGDSAARHATKFVPSGVERVGVLGRKDQDFDEFGLWLLRRTCSVMGVQPASIGYVGEQYKSSQGDSMESTSAFGAGALLTWRKEHYDDILRRIGYSDLECVDVNAREEDAVSRAQRNHVLIGAPVKTINEGRVDEGLDPVAGGDSILVPAGFVVLENIGVEPASGSVDAAVDTGSCTMRYD